MKKRPKLHKIAQKPHQNHTKPPKKASLLGLAAPKPHKTAKKPPVYWFGGFSEFHNPLLAKLTDLAGINY